MESETDTGFVGGGTKNPGLFKMLTGKLRKQTDVPPTPSAVNNTAEAPSGLFSSSSKSAQDDTFQYITINGHSDYKRYIVPQGNNSIAIEFEGLPEKFISYIELDIQDSEPVRQEIITEIFDKDNVSRDPKTPHVIRMHVSSKVHIMSAVDRLAATIGFEGYDMPKYTELVEVKGTKYYEVEEANVSNVIIKFLSNNTGYLKFEFDAQTPQNKIKVTDPISQNALKPTIIKMHPGSVVELQGLSFRFKSEAEKQSKTRRRLFNNRSEEINYDKTFTILNRGYVTNDKYFEINKNDKNIKIDVKEFNSPRTALTFFLQIEFDDSQDQKEIKLNLFVADNLFKNTDRSKDKSKPEIIKMNPNSEVHLMNRDGNAAAKIKVVDDSSDVPAAASAETSSGSTGTSQESTLFGATSETSRTLQESQNSAATAKQPSRSPEVAFLPARSSTVTPLRRNQYQRTASEPYRGANAAQICAELQSKFDGLARIACTDLKNILDEAGNNSNDARSNILLIEGNEIISAIRAAIDAEDAAQAS
jgi:hypothetical protein